METQSEVARSHKLEARAGEQHEELAELSGVVGGDDEAGPRRTIAETGGTLARIGLLERLELRAGWDGYVAEDDGRADGLGDTELGAKWRFGEERGKRPELALILGSTLPTGAERVSSERFDPTLRLCASQTLSERLSLGYNVGSTWESEEGDDGRRHTLGRALYTTSLGIGLSEATGVFLELSGEIGTSADGGPAHSFDTGLTHLLRPNLQLDVAAGIALSEDADDAFVGLGLSLRLPR